MHGKSTHAKLSLAAKQDPLPCTGGRLRKLTRRMTSFYEQHMRQTGLKLSQYSVLMNLTIEPQTLQELAARLEMDRTTLTRALRPLVDNGWVSQVEGQDQRQRRLILTTEGHRFRKQANQVWREAQLSLESHLGREFVDELNQRLELALAQLKPALPDEN